MNMNQSAIDIGIFIASVLVSGIVGAISASMKIGEYKSKVDTLETTMGKDEHNGLRKTVGDIRDKVVACETSLRERGPLTQIQSPVSLTERGLNLLKDSGGEKFVDDNFDELVKEVEKLDPKTAYDVQEDSKAVVAGLSNDDRLNPIKEFLFKDGSSLDEATTVMSIYLRDKVLKHKSWNVEDIDNHGNNE